VTPRCLLCGKTAFRTVYEDARLTVVRCSSCGLVHQADYAGTLARLDGSYTDPATYYAERGLASHRQPRFDPKKLARTSDILEEMRRRLRPGSRVLDVGCGDGEFLSALVNAGFDALGVEPEPASASFATEHSGAQVIVASYAEEQIPLQSLDGLTLIQVLEHVEDPLNVLRTAYSHLRPGGLLVIDVPSYNNPRILAYRLTGVKRLARKDFIPPHCCYYTRATLRHLVEGAGFRVTRIITGRYAVKTGNSSILFKAIDIFANWFGIGGITLYATK